MKVVGLLGGGAPVVRRYQVAASLAAEIPVLIAAANGAGVATSTTTSTADAVGVTIDSAAYTTTQGSGENSAESLISVIINPDAIVQANLSGGATAGTAMVLFDVTTADAGGTTITTGDNFSSPTMDEGTIWGYDGANAKQVRKITSVTTTAATVTVPFDYGTVVGDNFMRAPFWPLQGHTAQLTSDLKEINTAIAVGTGAAMKCIRVIAQDEAHDGRSKSKAEFIFGDHFLNKSG